MKVMFIHGIGQNGTDGDALRMRWTEALRYGLSAGGLELPNDFVVKQPYFGNALKAHADAFRAKGSSGQYLTQGVLGEPEYDRFSLEILQALAAAANVRPDESDKPDYLAQDAQNSWLALALARALEKKFGKAVIKAFLEEVYVYLYLPAVRKEIDDIVMGCFDKDVSVVVGHSLGSVIAYNLLAEMSGRSMGGFWFLTVGSPLGLDAVKKAVERHPGGGAVVGWKNARDPQDIVALHPLIAKQFPTDKFKFLENFDGVHNGESNQHGIAGYLGNTQVAKWIIGTPWA